MANSNNLSASSKLKLTVVLDEPFLNSSIDAQFQRAQEIVNERFKEMKVNVSQLQLDLSQAKTSLANPNLAKQLQDSINSQLQKQVATQTKNQQEGLKQKATAKVPNAIPQQTASMASAEDDLKKYLSTMAQLRSLTVDLASAQKAVANNPMDSKLQANLKDSAAALKDYIQIYSTLQDKVQKAYEKNPADASAQQLVAQMKSKLTVAQTQLERAEISASPEMTNLNQQKNLLKQITDNISLINQAEQRIQKLTAADPKGNAKKISTLQTYKNDLQSKIDSDETTLANLDSQYQKMNRLYDASALVQQKVQEINKLQGNKTLLQNQPQEWDTQTQKMRAYTATYGKLIDARQRYNQVLKQAKDAAVAGDNLTYNERTKEAAERRGEIASQEASVRRSVSNLRKQTGYLPDYLQSTMDKYKDLALTSRKLEGQANVDSSAYVRNLENQIAKNKELVTLNNKLAQSRKILEKDSQTGSLTSEQRQVQQNVYDTTAQQIKDVESQLAKLEKRAGELERPKKSTAYSQNVQKQLENILTDRTLAEAKNYQGTVTQDYLTKQFSAEIAARKSYNSELQALAAKAPGLSKYEYEQEVAQLEARKKAIDDNTESIRKQYAEYTKNQQLNPLSPLAQKSTELTNVKALSKQYETEAGDYNRLLNIYTDRLQYQKQLQADYLKNSAQLAKDPGNTALEDANKKLADRIKVGQQLVDHYKTEVQNRLKTAGTTTPAMQKTVAEQKVLENQVLRGQSDIKIADGKGSIETYTKQYRDLVTEAQNYQKTVANFSKMSAADSGYNQQYKDLLAQKDAILQKADAYKTLISRQQSANQITLSTAQSQKFDDYYNRIVSTVNQSSTPLTSDKQFSTNINAQMSSLQSLESYAKQLKSAYADLDSAKLSGNSSLAQAAQARVDAIKNCVVQEKAQLEQLKAVEAQMTTPPANAQALATQNQLYAQRNAKQATVDSLFAQVNPESRMLAQGTTVWDDMIKKAEAYRNALKKLGDNGYNDPSKSGLVQQAQLAKQAYEDAEKSVQSFYKSNAGNGKISQFANQNLQLKAIQSEIKTAQDIANGVQNPAKQIESVLKEIGIKQSQMGQYGKIIKDSFNSVGTIDVSQHIIGFETVDAELGQLVSKFEALRAQNANLFNANGMPLNANLSKLYSNYQTTQPNIQALRDTVNPLQYTQTQITKLQEISAAAQQVRTLSSNGAPYREIEQAYGVMQGLVKTYNESYTAMNKMATAQGEIGKQIRTTIGDTDKATVAYEKQGKVFATTDKQMAMFLERINKYGNNSTAMKGTLLGQRLEQLQASATASYNKGDFDKAQLGNYEKEFANIKLMAQEAGVATQAFGDKLINAGKQFLSWYGTTTLITSAISGFKQMVNEVKAIDASMVELKKVTDLSAGSYDKFVSDAGETARRIGVTVTDVIDSTVEFARLGNTMDASTKLAEAALVFKTVGDGITDASDASNKIISIQSAFGIAAEDSMSIVDKLNEVGKQVA